MLDLQPAPAAARPRRRRVRLRGPAVVLLVSGLMAVVLFGSALLIQRRVQLASEWAARGEAEAFVVAIRDALLQQPDDPDALLRELLATFEEDGLRYIALVHPGGRLLAEAGEGLGRGAHADALEQLGSGRVRWAAELGRPEGRRFRRWRGRHTPEPLLRMRGALLVLELEPLAAAALQREAKNLLAVAGLAGLGILGLALAFTRLLGQQERLRDELEAGQRLAALGTMSAVLAHELRNPLAAIKGHAQLLAEDVEVHPELLPQAQQMVRGAVRLERLLDNLLRFVKTGAIERTPVDPNLPLEEAARDFGARIHRTEGPTAPVLLDAERVSQALTNLLRNAVEASPKDAAVEASVSRVGDRILYRVRDHGPGLPQGAEATLFEPFTTHKARGVGLGLAITRRIAELHGGQVEARTLPEGGACFTLTLPVGTDAAKGS